MIAIQNPSPMPIPIPYTTNNESLYYQLHRPYPLVSPQPTSTRHHHTYSVPALLPPFALSLNTPPSTPSKKSHNKRNHKSSPKQHKRRSNSEFEMTMALDLSDLSTPSSTPSPPHTPVTPSTFSSFSASPSRTPPPAFPVRGYAYGHGRSPSLPILSSASSSFSSTSSGSGSSFGDRYANSTFQNSPPPQGLPKPRFLSE